MRSDLMKKGVERAPHRSLFKAMGYTDEEIARPLIGVVNSYNEIIPGHIHLRTITEHVKAGIRMAGGTPVEFPAIGVCDGIAMGHVGMKYSLASRELIADSVEIMAMAHPFDGLVFIPNCDKVVPGMLMAALRLNIPSIFISGGPMLAGKLRGKPVDLITVFEGVGAVKSGKMTARQLKELEDCACPGCGSCSGMYTANTMNCMTEALGMGLPGNGTVLAVDSARHPPGQDGRHADHGTLKKNIRPRDIATLAAFKNAIAVDMALGGSTNTVLHLPAIAHEAGIRLDLDLFNQIGAKTPNLCKLSPAGAHHIEDLEAAGGVQAVMKEISKLGVIDQKAMTVSGKTVAKNLKETRVYDYSVIRSVKNPYSPDGGLAIIKGNLAPEGGVVKRSAVSPDMLVNEGRARVFDSEDDAIAAILGGKIKPGDVIVIRYEGPKGGPGHARDARPHLGAGRHGPGRVGGALDRRALQRRLPRRGDRPHLARGGRGRPHRAREGRRPHRHRHPEAQDRPPGERRGTEAAQEGMEAPEAQDPVGLPLPVRKPRDLREHGRHPERPSVNMREGSR